MLHSEGLELNRCIYSFLFILLFVAVLISEQGCSSSGRTVTLFRSNSKPVTGELISARKNCLLLDTTKVDWSAIDIASKRSQALQSIAKVLSAIGCEKGDSIRVEGEYHVWEGVLVGFGITAFAAGIAALSGESGGWFGDPGSKALFASVLVGTPAILLGLIGGASSTHAEENLSMQDGAGCDALKKHARYEDNEPKAFESIQCSKKN